MAALRPTAGGQCLQSAVRRVAGPVRPAEHRQERPGQAAQDYGAARDSGVAAVAAPERTDEAQSPFERVAALAEGDAGHEAEVDQAAEGCRTQRREQLLRAQPRKPQAARETPKPLTIEAARKLYAAFLTDLTLAEYEAEMDLLLTEVGIHADKPRVLRRRRSEMSTRERIAANFQKSNDVLASSTRSEFEIRARGLDQLPHHRGAQQKAGVSRDKLRRLVLKELADNALDTGSRGPGRQLADRRLLRRG